MLKNGRFGLEGLPNFHTFTQSNENSKNADEFKKLNVCKKVLHIIQINDMFKNFKLCSLIPCRTLHVSISSQSFLSKVLLVMHHYHFVTLLLCSLRTLSSLCYLSVSPSAQKVETLKSSEIWQRPLYTNLKKGSIKDPIFDLLMPLLLSSKRQTSIHAQLDLA